MPKLQAINEVRTWSYLLGYEELLSGAFGTQDSVVIHPIMPPGWLIDAVGVETVEAFNGAGTRTFDLGTSIPDNGDAIIDGLDVKAAGIKDPTVFKNRVEASTPIVGNLITGTDNPTTGKLRVTIVAMQVMREHDYA